MGVNLVDKTTPTQGQSVDTHGSAQVKLYDAYGNPIFFPQAGSFDVAALADRETFGASISAGRVAAIVLDWSQALAANPVNTLLTNSGTATQASGQLQIATGTNVSGQATVQTKQSIRYVPGREMYGMFSAAFTTPTNTASDQRAGYYSGSAYAGTGDGFYVGYHGLLFGITQRVGGVETFTAQTAFNIDTLSAAAGSQFTSAGSPVALSPTFLNVWRVRWGWLGAAVVTWQIMAPDGNWVTFHRYRVPNSQLAPTTTNPTLPLTFESLKNAADANSMTVYTSSAEAGVVSSPTAQNKVANSFDSAIVGSPMLGLDSNTVLRVPRLGGYSSMRTTSETMLWQDALEGSTVNTFWTQSTTNMTIAQAAGVLTLNNSGITTASSYAIITSQRQFPKYPRNPLYMRFTANLSALVAGNHTIQEMGFGAPVGTTAIVNNGAFFRMTEAGTVVGVVSYGGTETTTGALITAGQLGFSTSNYYICDVIVDDAFVRFVVTDSNGVPVVDTSLSVPLTNPSTWAVSHLPTFARVYTDATGGGTAVKFNIAGHTVQILDGQMVKDWEEQLASAMRQASINPTSYAQTGSSLIAAPATETPSNTVAGYNALGGDYAVALTAASENPLSVFAFQIPTPYSFYLKGLVFSVPFVTTAISVTGIPILEWLLIANNVGGNISTGGGQRVPLGLNHFYTTATQGAGVALYMSAGTATTGGAPASGAVPYVWQPKVPILCLPGTYLHFAYKVFITSAITTAGVTRGSIFVDGYFE
jgi:hypothetical protein